ENIDLSADKIILDSPNLKSKNVKGALEELFTSGNNVKNDTVDALLSIDENLQITRDSPWRDIIQDIGRVTTGKKWARGTGTTTESSDKQVRMFVYDLDFTPGTVIIKTRSDNYRNDYIIIDCPLFKYETDGWYDSRDIILKSGYVYKSSNSFYCYANDYKVTKGTTFQWIAFE
ncbi:phage tail protein, partial [Clostridium botulinum]|nr:phage tail protein [Clostridium botulinum]